MDPSESAREHAVTIAAELGGSVTAYEELPDALRNSSQPYDLAVVANWGPDHPATVRDLLAAGVRDFVVEKPLADSIEGARSLLDGIKNAGGSCWVNLTRRYSGLPTGILRLQEQFDLGELMLITVSGGARCLATNGIHYLDFATLLFDSAPVSVTSDVVNAAINPRDPALAFLEGAMTYRFPGDRRFTCTFSNSSSVSEIVRLYWREAEAEILPDQEVVLRLRDPQEIERFPAITRTGYARDEVFRGPLSLTADGRTGLAALYDDLLRGASPAGGEMAAEWLLAALHASESGQRLTIPVDEDLVDISRGWRIS